MDKQLYLRFLPESMYKPMARREVHPLRMWHRLRWHLLPRESLRRWTERRLQLDGHYWLFILGLNNSGTTLLKRILASHPSIRALPEEGQLLSFSLPRAAEHGVLRTWSSRPDIFRWREDDHPERGLRVKYDWAYFAERRPGILLAKSPQDSGRGRWLQRHFQPCRFLVMVRHPYAVCEGIMRRRPVSAAEAARHWVEGNRFILEDLPHLDRHLWIKYEELCDRTAETLRRIESFLDLAEPIDTRVLSEPIRAPNMDRTPRPLGNFNRRSIARLSDEDLAVIDREAASLMDHFHYARGRTHAEEQETYDQAPV